MTKTRDLANLVSGSNPLVDGVIDYSEITNTPAPFDPNTLATVATTGDYSDLINIQSGVPSGGIIVWSGAANAIPSGWLICDGANATPDLRDRFVIGAGSTYAVAATGGATTTSAVAAHTHTLSGNTSASGTHTHTGSTSNTGSHSHDIPTSWNAAANYEGVRWERNDYSWATPYAGAHSHTFTTAAGGDHTHTLSGTAASTGDASVSIMNPYYALCYIMKT